jgi:glutaredoxin
LLTLNFYTTSACHLCDAASNMLTEINKPIQLITIDIANDDQLIEQYGTRIPVLKRDDTQLELEWPFTLTELQKYIS